MCGVRCVLRCFVCWSVIAMRLHMTLYEFTVCLWVYGRNVECKCTPGLSVLVVYMRGCWAVIEQYLRDALYAPPCTCWSSRNRSTAHAFV
jgi:hypothetical protein